MKRLILGCIFSITILAQAKDEKSSQAWQQIDGEWSFKGSAIIGQNGHIEYKEDIHEPLLFSATITLKKWQEGGHQAIGFILQNQSGDHVLHCIITPQNIRLVKRPSNEEQRLPVECNLNVPIKFLVQVSGQEIVGKIGSTQIRWSFEPFAPCRLQLCAVGATVIISSIQIK